MDKNAKLACCQICLLSDAMKRCKTCPFNPMYLAMSDKQAQAIIKAELKKEVEAQNE